MATPDALELIAPGTTVGAPELPHRHVPAALDFAFDAFDIPTAAALPRRSPDESSLGQALSGLARVTETPDGELHIEVEPGATWASIGTGLDAPAFEALQAFIERCRRRDHAGVVRWTLPGPLTAGTALVQAGVAPSAAFKFAGHAVRGRLAAIADAFAAAAPRARQLIVVDESLAGLGQADGPLSPGEATDLLSSALAEVERVATVGVRVGTDADLALLLEAGPRVIEIPTTADTATYAGYLGSFLARGGWITWGVVDTEGPIVDTPTRAWKRLNDTWCGLVQRGCDPAVLRRQALFSTTGGLAAHTPAGAVQIAATVGDVARLVRAEAGAARFVLGA